MKTIPLTEIVKYFDEILKIDSIPDKANNGLQIEASLNISQIVFAVDTSLKLFEFAKEKNAELVFTHHGISWNDELKRITGINAKRISFLFKNNISLYSAHLPLDCHPTLNHNTIIAKKILLTKCKAFAKFANTYIGVKGFLRKKSVPPELAKLLNKILNTKSKIYGNVSRNISKIAIIAGSPGTEAIIEAARQNIDCLITGEIHHSSFHTIEESGISVIAAGHYATEKPGIIALMNKVSNDLKIKTNFFEYKTGM
ncbi:MAG TPA: Nif3-like dinuclear metal center hexameric protein [Victivallales bacterium]|nr:Nif3-like dinuclear metal center hexameric protein [Victivallales bacterium]HPO91454.1 Nif3-like dinuclear metal center hexameric protein [Victivallales bacterium]HRR06320.1 Nif3-like dinuclear metal center hexameric protein [Victivallales bacterium]HRU00728.1 Nif3-like dinuclear metal center hexameric protein [Victivallales bacterium]